MMPKRGASTEEQLDRLARRVIFLRKRPFVPDDLAWLGGVGRRESARHHPLTLQSRPRAWRGFRSFLDRVADQVAVLGPAAVVVARPAGMIPLAHRAYY